MPDTRATLVLALVLVCGCLRAPIDGDALDDAGGDPSSTGAIEDADGPGMSGPIAPHGGDSSDDADATSAADPACHASYLPCLPVVDDLDCDEVREMGAAPVEVIGEDAYGLDADADGIGCEN
jgi:hypothetical protein